MPVINKAITVSFQVRNAATGAPVTGDAANLTLQIVNDGASSTPTNSPVEVALGEYKLALTIAENSGQLMAVIGTSSTTNAIIIPARWQNIDATIGSRAAPSDLANLDAAVSSRAVPSNFATLEGRLTAERAGYLDASIAERATLDAITAMTLESRQQTAAIEGRLTETRAGYLDNLNGLGDLSNLANLDVAVSTRATPGSLSAIVATISLTGGTEVDGNEVTLIRGDTTPLYLAMKNETNSPIDLSAYVAGTFTLTVKPQRNRDDTDDVNKVFDATGTIADAASGIVLFNIGAADTELLSRGECYDFDVQYDSGDGATIKTFIVGEIKLQYDVTRTSSA